VKIVKLKKPPEVILSLFLTLLECLSIISVHEAEPPSAFHN